MTADGRPHLLVMNDAQEILDLLLHLLEDEGYRVSTARIVLDLERVQGLAPDLIVLDVLFEKQETGWQFLSMTRLDPHLRRVPIVLCTAAAKPVREMEGHLATQNVGVVLKPFDVDQLLREVEARLTAREREDVGSRGAG